MQSYREDLSRENFKLPGAISNVGKNIAKGTTTAAKAVGKGTTTAAKAVGKGTTTSAKAVAKGTSAAAKGLKNISGLIWQKIFGFLKMLWQKFKLILSCVCCTCVLSCCFSLGIPQSMMSLIPENKNV
jgi:hypothetical protein